MSLYNFYEMRKKKYVFASDSIGSTYDRTYEGWEEHFSGQPYVGYHSTNYWAKLQERFGEKVQLSILLAVTIPGIAVSDWKEVFADIYNETGLFPKFSYDLTFYDAEDNLDWWALYADRIAKSNRFTNYYPCVTPQWLYPYSYYLNQYRYIGNLQQMWLNIHTDYHIPWEGTRLGQDSPEVARIRMVGQEARREIDVTAQHGFKRHQGR